MVRARSVPCCQALFKNRNHSRVAMIPFVTALLPVRSSSSAWLGIQPFAFLLGSWNGKSAGQFRQWRRQREAQGTQPQARRMEAVAVEIIQPRSQEAPSGISALVES